MTANLGKALIRGGFASLFLHEQYHHKTESLAIRLHVVEQAPRFPAYFQNVYIPSAGTDDQIEEGLANADSWRRLEDAPYAAWLGVTLRRTLQAHLEASFTLSPPGYRLAAHLLTPPAFDAAEEVLKSQVQEATLAPGRPMPADFEIASHLNRSLFTINQNIWAVMPRGRTPMLPVRPGSVAPLSRLQVERFLTAAGYKEDQGRGKGSHKMYRRAGASAIVLPRAKDLSPVVLRNTAKALGLAGARELVGAINK